MATPTGPVALFTATLHPSDDVAHQGPPQGLLVIGKRLDDEFLAHLSATTGTELAWVDPGLTPAPAAPAEVVAYVPIHAQDGAVIGTLAARSTIPALAHIFAEAELLIGMLFAVALVVMVLSTLALRVWVVNPLRQLAAGLQAGHVGPLGATLERSDEFGDLARLMMLSFSQRAAIEAQMEERAEFARALEHLAMHDPLTGLPNRVMFNDRLTTALAQSERQGTLIAVVAIDLDRFKHINDTLGHAAGDELLVAVGRRLTSSIRAGDTAARMGGDEFVLLLTDIVSAEQALDTGRRVLQAFREPFTLAGQPVSMSLSLGVCLYPSDATSPEALLKGADEAMYEVKHAGRNDVRLWVPSDPSSGAERDQLAQQLDVDLFA